MVAVRKAGKSLLSGLIQLFPPQKRISLVSVFFRAVEDTLDKEGKKQLRQRVMGDVFGERNPSWPSTETWALRRFVYDQLMNNFTMQTSYEVRRTYGLIELLSRLEQVPGDVVECGVGFGKSLTVLAYGVQILKLEKTVYGFDSFSGFPQASAEDIGPRVKEIEKPSGWTATSPAYIESIFTTDQQREDTVLNQEDFRLQLIPGFFADTLPDHVPQQIAFLHVDCDLYESTHDVLKYCLPRVSNGGIVLFDEYQDPKWPGATRAVDEVGADQQLELIYFPNVDRFGWQL